MIAVATALALASPATLPTPAAPAPAIAMSRPLAVTAIAAAPALSPDVEAQPAAAAPAPVTTTPPVGNAPQQPIDAPSAVPAARTPGDPYEKFNRRMFARYQKFDRAVLRPVALGYKQAVPRPVRSGIRHFFSNLGEPIVALNFLLQGKPGKAVATLGRFVINSTIGIGGLVDVAKSSGIPHRPNGFGDTLGFYGVKPGPYLFLPVIGPTTLRDLFGSQVDGAVLPLAVGKPFNRLYYQLPRAVLTGLDERAQSEGDLNALLGSAVDPYATLRSVYLQDRAGEIAALHGRKALPEPANDNLADPLVDPASGTAPPPANAPELDDPLADPAAAMVR